MSMMENDNLEFESESWGENHEPDEPKWVKIPIQRGFEAIRPIWNIINPKLIVIAGGYARFCASKREKPVRAGDVDLFPQTETASDALIQNLLDRGFQKRHENEISFTFKKFTDKNHPLYEQYKDVPTLQVIKPLTEGRVQTVGTVEEILSNFDFTVTRIAIISETECLADEDFIEDDGKKILRIKNIHCPVSSLLRSLKYGRKGYHLRPAEAMKLFADWDNRGDDYKLRILELFKNSSMGEATQEEIDELEGLLRID